MNAVSVATTPTVAGEPEIRRLRTLYQLLAALSRATELQDVYEAALNSLLEATAANRAAILIFDDNGVIQFKASRGLSQSYIAAVTGHSPWARGSHEASPIVVPDSLRDELLAPFRAAFEQEGIGALAFVPLMLDAAGVIGKFMLYYDRPHVCTCDELEIAQAIASHVALATQHKRAELALLRNQRQLQAIIDNSPAMIWMKDREGRYLLVNRQCQELLQLNGKDMIGRTDRELFPEELAERYEGNDRAVLASGGPIVVEECAQLDDGLHTYISTKFPLQGPDGTVSGVCGIATDITDRAHLEIAQQRLVAIVESSDDAIASKDLNGIITSWNKGAERVFGYTAEEVMGKPVSILAVPGNNEMPDILSKIRRGERVVHYETQRRRKDGEIIDVALTVSPIRDSAGKVIGASKIARDITDRKLVEQERTQLLARERDARRTAELLNRVGPRLAAQLDLEKLTQEVTDIATALVGAEFGSFFHNVVGENGESYMLYSLSGVPREAFEGFPMPRNTELFAPTFEGKGVVRCDDVFMDPRYGKNAPHHGMPEGHLPVRSYLAAPVVARSGEVLGGLFFGHSQTSQFTATHEAIVRGIAAQTAIAMDNARLFEQSQWIQTELKRSNEELRRANRDLEVFAYSASHDLKDPLRTIAISAQLIERSGQLNGDDAEFLSNIVNAAERMNTLIQDLLAYTTATKYEQSRPPVVDSGGVLAGVLESLRGPIEEVGAEITSGELPAVAIHESRLAQIFQNLISNAIKYRSKEVPRVHVTAQERDGWCVFSVVDNGIGIEPRFAEQIFGLFKRLHSRDEYPGSGVGLSICQRIVDQYGGRIWLEQSVLGGGSTFCFAIPSRPGTRPNEAGPSG